MDDRIHRFLDGDGAADDLSPEERCEIETMLAAINDVIEPLRSMDAPDLSHRVMAEIQGSDAPASVPLISGIRELTRWLWTPRSIALSWRPVYSLGFSIVVALLVASVWGSGPGPVTSDVRIEDATDATDAPPASLFVQFRLEAPGAVSVAVTGSFTNWADGVDLIETIPGIWSTLLPLEPGVHDYTFIIDGEFWVLDPTAPAIDDGFGGSKNRLFLTDPIENA